MRKINFKLAFVLIAVMVLIAGCNFAFSSIVSVIVTGPDSSDNSFDSTVYVFGFTDEEAWNTAYRQIVEKGKDSASGKFDAFLESYIPAGVVDKRLATYASGNDFIPGINNSSGTVATLTIRWNTTSPAYGEDYDSTRVYVIAAVEENGICYAGANDWHINSGNSEMKVNIDNVNNIDLDSTI